MDRKRQEPKQTKEEYRTPELIRHGTIDEVTQGGQPGEGDLANEASEQL
jgi:hypothetical protein